MQLELRPGEPGYSGPTEEFGDEPDFIAAEEVAEADVIETVPPSENAAQHEAQPAKAAAPHEPRTETPPAPPAASDGETEAERAPVTYNVSPPHEVSGPASNPRRGWWRR